MIGIFGLLVIAMILVVKFCKKTLKIANRILVDIWAKILIFFRNLYNSKFYIK